MAILVSNTGGGAKRDYPSLYFGLCRCGGPQPSLSNPRADEHDRECAYRVEVERDAQRLP